MYGELGDGSGQEVQLTPVDVLGLTSPMAAIAVGNGHTCAAATNGGVKCWGNNTWGQLGNDTTIEHDTPTDVTGLTSGATDIAAGFLHTCAAMAGGGIKCWGNNAYGQLGNGLAANVQRVPVDVVGLVTETVFCNGFESEPSDCAVD